MGLFSGLRGQGLDVLDKNTSVMAPIVAAMLAIAVMQHAADA